MGLKIYPRTSFNSLLWHKHQSVGMLIVKITMGGTFQESAHSLQNNRVVQLIGRTLREKIYFIWKKPIFLSTDSKLFANAMEEQPTTQNLVETPVSHVLQVSNKSPKRSGHSKCFCPELLWHRNRSRNTFYDWYKLFQRRFLNISEMFQNSSKEREKWLYNFQSKNFNSKNWIPRRFFYAEIF